MTNDQLILEAKKAREHAYAPYSCFKVGAALLTKQGTLYHGCNIENAAYTPSNCAERTAFFQALYHGERDFEKIAIIGGKEGGKEDVMCTPCGVCLQVMMEFCNPENFQIILMDRGTQIVFLLKELLPYGFGPENLK